VYLNKIFTFVLCVYFAIFFGLICLVRTSSFSMLKKLLDIDLLNLTLS